MLSNAYGLSKNTKEFLTGIRSTGTFIHGALDANFLAENKCSIRDVQVWQEFDYKGHKLWYRTGYGYGNITTKDPHNPKDPNWNWRTENDFMSPILKDEALAANLQPRDLYFFANIHGKQEQWVFNLAENILLGTEPCLQKIEQPNSK